MSILKFFKKRKITFYQSCRLQLDPVSDFFFLFLYFFSFICFIYLLFVLFYFLLPSKLVDVKITQTNQEIRVKSFQV